MYMAEQRFPGQVICSCHIKLIGACPDTESYPGRMLCLRGGLTSNKNVIYNHLNQYYTSMLKDECHYVITIITKLNLILSKLLYLFLKNHFVLGSLP